MLRLPNGHFLCHRLMIGNLLHPQIDSLHLLVIYYRLFPLLLHNFLFRTEMDHLRKISTISCIELQRRGKICRFLKINGVSGLVGCGISADGLNIFIIYHL